MLGHVPRHSLGGIVCHSKRIIGNVDRTMRTVGAVYNAVKHVIPPSNIKAAAERGLSTYAEIRQAIRNNAPPL